MIDLNVDDVAFLQCGENMIQDTLLGPAVGARVNRVPVAEFLWQPATFAAMFRDIQNGIEYLVIGYGYVTQLFW